MKTRSLALLTTTSLAACLGTSTHAATIVYDFEAAPTAFEQNNSNTQDYTNWTEGGTINSPAASNDFGSGVTTSNWSFTDGTGDNRYIGYVTESGQAASDGVEARAMLGANTQTHSFTITIPDNVVVDLTNYSWESGTVFAEHAWELDIIAASGQTFATADNPITTTESGARREVQNDVDLTGLTGLTDTTVTVTITDLTPRNNNQTIFYSFIDNAVLTGSVVGDPIPEPASIALVGLGGLCMLGRRRR